MKLPLLMAVTVSVAALAAGAPAFAAAAPAKPAPLVKPTIVPKSESACGVLVGQGDKKPPAYKEAAGFKVLGGPEKLALPKTDGKVVAVRCTRDTVVPADGDGRVIFELRVPFSITDGPRTLRLQLAPQKKGEPIHYSVAMAKGTLTAAETTAVNAEVRILSVRLRALLQQEAAARAKAKAADAPVPTKK